MKTETAEERIAIWRARQAAGDTKMVWTDCPHCGGKNTQWRNIKTGKTGCRETGCDWRKHQAKESKTELAKPYACVKMSSVQPEKVSWLWKPYLPVGKITLLDGWPGIGKSWLTCMLAAIVSRGGGFPNSVAFEPGNVLMLSAEDGLGDTLRPRLDACGADVDRVIALNMLEKDGVASFSEEGLSRLEATIIQYRPVLLIIDPLFAFTGADVDIHRANECRAISSSLAAIAARQRLNALGIRHLNKTGGHGNA